MNAAIMMDMKIFEILDRSGGVIKRMSASDVKNRWGDLVRAVGKGEQVVVESRRDPILVAISPTDFEEFQALRKAKRLQEAKESLRRIQEMQRERTKNLSDAEADAIIERLMEEDRLERRRAANR